MATRSPSPSQNRPRTPDANNSLRKSKEFSAKSALRNSYEQKENEKKKPSLISNSKGSKHFMAPTISAASKIIPPSPKKKILQERNEVINCVSKSLEFPTFKEVGVSVEPGLFSSKPEMSFVCQDVLSSCDEKKEEFGVKNYKKNSPLTQITPSDAGQTLPPYDPKTNYLSPRPQFLHYRPNPRIEHYFSDVNGRTLEGSFSLDSSEEEEKELEFESEEGSFHSEIEEVESESEYKSKCETETPLVSDLDPESKCVSETIVISETKFEPKVKKNRSLTKLKVISFLLILVMTFLYAPLSDTPIFTSSVMKERYQFFLKIYTENIGVSDGLNLREYLVVASENLHSLGSRFNQWLTESIAYFTSVTSLPKDNVGFHYVNMTPSVLDDEPTSIYFNFEHESDRKQNFKETELEFPDRKQNFKETELEFPDVVEESDIDCEEESETEILDEESETQNVKEDEVADLRNEIGVVSEVVEVDNDDEAEKIEKMVPEYVKEGEVEKEIFEEIYANIVSKEITDLGNELEEATVSVDMKEDEVEKERCDSIYENIVEKERIDARNKLEQEASLHSYGEHGNTERESEYTEFVDENETIDDEELQTLRGLEFLKSMNFGTVFGLSLSVLVIAATIIFSMIKRKQALINQEETQAGSMGDSSNNLNTMRNIIVEDEEKSYERKMRRDSAASSSSFTSYGSFTTFERLSAKRGKRDEEVVTPVRRSSRIRSQFTSSP